MNEPVLNNLTGRQHDVSECMDNCMFQIETALLDFQGMATSDDDKTSPVKRYVALRPPKDHRTQWFSSSGSSTERRSNA